MFLGTNLTPYYGILVVFSRMLPIRNRVFGVIYLKRVGLMGLYTNNTLFISLSGNIYWYNLRKTMNAPNYNDIFNKFKDGVFKYVIKSDVMRKLPYVEDIELLDEYHTNSHTGKIYPLFVVRVNRNTLSSHHHYMITQRNLQTQILNVVKDGLDKFYPTGEFNLLQPNFEIIKV